MDNAGGATSSTSITCAAPAFYPAYAQYSGYAHGTG